MKQPKIVPVGDQIFLNVEEAKLGNLDASSVKTGMEWAVITAIGPDVQDKQLKPGVKVFCKGWAQDVILYEGKSYIFTSESRKGICAILK
jgi:co-chaperonin GroES (HSP10)